MKELYSRAEFTKFLFANFVSQTGTYLLTWSLSAFIFSRTQSILYASLVFVISYLPSVFFSSKLGNLIDRYISKKLIVSVEIVSAILSLFCGYLIMNQSDLTLFSVILIIRSLLGYFNKSAFNKWLKLISPVEKQAQRLKLHKITFFLSITFSGLLVSAFLTKDSIYTITIIDVFSYLLSALVVLSFKNPVYSYIENKSEYNISLINTYRYIFSIPRLKAAFALVVLSQGIIQGSYAVLINYLPLHSFKLPIQSVGIFHIAVTIGILIGAAVVYFFPNFMHEKKSHDPSKSLFCIVLAFVSIVLLCVNKSIPLAYLLFFLQSVLYELIYVHQSAEFFKACPRQHVARLQFNLQASAGAFMAIATFFFSFLMEKVDLVTSSFCLISFAILFWMFIHLLEPKLQKKSSGQLQTSES